MKKLRMIIALVLVLVFLCAGTSYAQIYFPLGMCRYNGHVYAVYNPMTWTEADAYCRKIGGHMLTINSAEENAFITDNILNDIGHAAMLGYSDAAEEGKWMWVNGTSGSYTNWAENEPNNEFEEDYALISLDGKWNDGHLDQEEWVFICEYDYPPYEWEYGWRLTNNPPSFGYEEGDSIDPTRYTEVYNYSIAMLLESTLGNIGTGSGGLCFGLCVLSLADYYGIYDASSLFTKPGDCIYDFGYDGIATYNGKDYYSIKDNPDARKFIERVQISQVSVEFAACEVFPYDPTYSQILEFMNSENARPLLVNIDGGVGQHSVVLTADFKPVDTGDGFYWLPVYDPNSPMLDAVDNGELKNPVSIYERGIAGLKLNPTTGEWLLRTKDGAYMGNGFYSMSGLGINAGFPTITFHDISLLDKSFFTGKLNCWYESGGFWNNISSSVPEDAEMIETVPAEPKDRGILAMFSDALPFALPVSLALSIVITVFSSLRKKYLAKKACTCPACGGELEPGEKFCGNCGQMLEWR